MSEIALWTLVAQELSVGNPVALATLVAKRASAPGRVGATLALGPNGRAVGTVGGGPPESRLILAARDLLGSRSAPTLQFLVHRRNDENASGLGCGGSGTYALWCLQPAAGPAVWKLVGDLRLGMNRRWSLGPAGWELADQDPAPDGLQTGEIWRFLHTAGPRGQALLVGGGHVNEALGRLLKACEFGVTVLDSRRDVAAGFDATAAHRVILGNYDNLGAVLAALQVQFVVVATHEPESDRAAISALLLEPLDYLGLLGSRAKIAGILGRPPFPAHVHAPAGVPIGSQTPEEIAISIAAEMVAARSARTTSPLSES
jgi:xanthine dehydrogenase accessory factor